MTPLRLVVALVVLVAGEVAAGRRDSSPPAAEAETVGLNSTFHFRSPDDGPSFRSLNVRLSFQPYDDTWTTFKRAFGRHYANKQEEAFRRQVFEDNVKRIEQHNLRFFRGKTTYWMGVSQFTDMTAEEYKAYNRLGGKTTKPAANSTTRQSALQCRRFAPPRTLAAAVPSSVDWRSKGYVTPVKNQGQCGSCWAFSTTGSMEGHHFRSTGKLLELSEQQLVDCSTGYGNEACNGGWMDFAFAYIFAAGGLENEASYPYYAKYGDCRFYSGWIVANLSGCYDVTKYSEADLKKAVASVGPVSVAIDASHQSFMSYSGGVYYEPECREDVQDHAVLVVGYGTQDGQDYWIVKNSWGETWGDQGYIKMARNRSNMCGIATSASFPV